MVLINHGVEDGLVGTMRLCRLEDYEGYDQEVCQSSVVFDAIDDEVDLNWSVHVLICVVSNIQETFKDPENRPNDQSNDLNSQLSCVKIARVTSRLD